jgi:RTX calcium-binding nonapeptide repeat (4 copies)
MAIRKTTLWDSDDYWDAYRHPPLGANDFVLARGGDDTVYGWIGDDLLCGGSGSDTLYGEDGRDDIDGGTGADFIYGGLHNDSVTGAQGNDTIWGEAGNDDFHGNEDYDTLYGGTGSDRLYGGGSFDDLYGGTGVDLLSGADGDDYFYFDEFDSGDVFDNRADIITDFSDLDEIWLKGNYPFAGNIQSPGDGEYSIWQKDADWVITWNTAADASFHDVVVKGGDPNGDISFYV